jgi:hypothetical protein
LTFSNISIVIISELVPKPGWFFHKLLWFFGLRPAKPLFFKVAVPKLKFWNSLK